MDSFSHALLQTKLQRPRYPRDFIVRPRLLERLNRAAVLPLTLVCAPAGYGKTSLVSSWLAGLATESSPPPGPMSTTWISLDAGDSELRLFLRYFIAGLRISFPGACPETLGLLHARRELPPAQVIVTLANEIAQLPQDFVVALDDYQTISGTAVQDLLSELLRHWPQPMHLVLISRQVPGLPLAGLRANGQISEIRTRDLRFTSEETAAYLNQALPEPLSPPAAELLEARTEGWVAGLQLAALSLRTADDRVTVLAGLSGNQPDFAAYLIEAALSHLPAEIMSFLHQTANLDQFCAALCQAVIKAEVPGWDAKTCIDWLERENLFIVTLDNQKVWYRYHNLFRGLLQQRAEAELGPDRIATIGCRAASWFAERGRVDEALRYALWAQDFGLAVRVVEQGLRDVLNREDRPTLERWLRIVPPDLVQESAGLLMAKAWALQFSWQLDAQVGLVRQATALLDGGADTSLSDEELRTLRGQIAVLAGQGAYFSCQYPQAIAYCREALALLPESWSYCRGRALIYLGLATAADGQADAAENLLVQEYRALEDRDSATGLRILLALCLVYYTEAEDLERLRQTGHRIAELAGAKGLQGLQSWGQYLLGLAHYQRNELVEAEQDFARLLRAEYSAQPAVLRDGVMRLALIKQTRGQAAEAREMLDVLGRLDLDSMGREAAETAALRARLALMAGDLENAARWADALSAPVPDQALLLDDPPHLVKAQILLARGTAADVQAALETLAALYDMTERTHNTRLKIEVAALWALALAAAGQSHAAESMLKVAVGAARPGGFVRAFVNFGPAMQRTLEQLAKQAEADSSEPHPAAQTARRILAEFPNHEPAAPSSGSMRIAPALPTAGSGRANGTASGVQPLVERLTPRELEILHLMREPISLKEIAPMLHITYQTVRRHNANILGKLGVNKRWAAVAKAETLGLLPPR